MKSNVKGGGQGALLTLSIILAAAWDNMRDGFMQWVANEEARLDNTLAGGYPMQALERLNEILGEGEGECRYGYVETPFERVRLTCDTVATVWRMLQEKYPDVEQRYRELAARREEIQAEIEQWQQAQAYLERVKAALQASDGLVEVYQASLEDLDRARRAYARHPDIPVYAKRWLDVVSR